MIVQPENAFRTGGSTRLCGQATHPTAAKTQLSLRKAKPSAAGTGTQPTKRWAAPAAFCFVGGRHRAGRAPVRPAAAALSLWLNATGAPAEVAARAGHSARVLRGLPALHRQPGASGCAHRRLPAYRVRLPASPRDRKWFLDGPFTVQGRASLCPVALIAAGSCERAAGSGGAERPRSGAAGALDAAARERIMVSGGNGSEPGTGWFRLAWGLSLGDGGDLFRCGTGTARRLPGLPRPAGASPRPVT